MARLHPGFMVPVIPGRTGVDSEWEPERLDLRAYLERVGYGASLEPTIQTLQKLHAAHVFTIPFENLDILLGRSMELDLESLQAKLVRRSRGGYCFEHNLLFAAALERLGFHVVRLAGRVRSEGSQIRPRTHILLKVTVRGFDWIADVGFGGSGLTEPLRLAHQETAEAHGWTHRLSEEGSHWVLRRMIGEDWQDLYSFTLEPQHLVDYIVANHFTSTHPRSPFTRELFVQMSRPRERISLRGDLLERLDASGERETRKLSAQERRILLTSDFGLDLSEEALRVLDSQA